MLILASGSPRRKHLLESVGIAFTVQPAEVEEQNDIPDPRELVETNAQLKADWVADKNPEAWVLGSDTTVALGDEILNKPVDILLTRLDIQIGQLEEPFCLNPM